VLECTSCNTMNPVAETVCLSCGTPLTTDTTRSTGLSGASGRCPAGHPVDPSWVTCPYCDRPQPGAARGDVRTTRLEGEATPALTPSAAKRTRLEGAAAPSRPAGRTRLADELPWPQPETVAGPRPTRLEEPPPRRGRATVLHDAGDGASVRPAEAAPVAPAAAIPPLPAPAAEAPARRLLAVLAAPDLGAGGAVFAVRSGRNTLGSGHGNDIVLDADSEVSREHAVILHRNDTFHLADRLSTNGTWVNDREVPANGTVPIEDRDRIRLGRSELVFLRIDGSLAVPLPD
jgi:hypothetical protein